MKAGLIGIVVGALVGSSTLFAAEESKEAAKDAAKENSVEAAVDVTLSSAYVWRGQIINEDGVIQPALTIGKGGLSLNVWNNMNMTDKVTPEKGQFSETDLTASYALPIETFDLSAGVVEYLYPNTIFSSTREVFVKAAKEITPIPAASNYSIKPFAEVYYDFDEANGFYGSAGIINGIKLCSAADLNASFSSGYASSDYNAYYFGVDKSEWNDGNIAVSTPFKLPALSGFTFTPLVQYSWLWKSDICRGAEESGALFNKANHHGDHYTAMLTVGYEF